MKLLLILFLSMGWAAESKEVGAHKNMDHKAHKHKQGHNMEAGLKALKPTMAIIKVQGMVCAFCAQGIEKNFNKRKEVKKTDVDLDKMEVTVHFNKGMSLDKKNMEEIVKGAGFAFKGLKK